VATEVKKTSKNSDPAYIFTLGMKQGKDEDEALAPFMPYINYKEDEKTIAIARDNYKKDLKSKRSRDYNFNRVSMAD
tara:strand:+ start:370 stop:600 length:231 start_codon:yes stop_codon:yes gene_type:complete